MALLVLVISVVCAVAVYRFQEGAFDFFNAWMHGLDPTMLKSDQTSTLDRLAYSLYCISLTGLLTSVLFVARYILGDKCPACR